ncbi:MAG: 2-oxo-3-hexenedioate decarboxylase [Sinimarinibacterium flocculans]|uniref:2-oxo-3-hexenedioate decarboxylase n=1 Tax=Sinimarinibacterium flocculans TaxID=985250 RepID=UPI003C48E36B
MKLDQASIAALAEHLDGAELSVKDVPKITDQYPDLDWGDAYAIQDGIRKLKQARGQNVVGYKAGLTSRAKMEQMGVTTPVFGLLFDYMKVPEGSDVDTRGLIHPKVEAELAFVLKRPLRGPGCNIGNVLAATDFVVPAVEVIDSRYQNFRFDLQSVIADNTSASRYIAGGRRISELSGLDLRTLGIVLEKNGEIVALAAGAAVLGHPAAAVAMLANHLGRYGQELPAGSFIMTGGITEAIPVAAGDTINVRFQDLGNLSIRFI